jgi:hypothetical protein
MGRVQSGGGATVEVLRSGCPLGGAGREPVLSFDEDRLGPPERKVTVRPLATLGIVLIDSSFGLFSAFAQTAEDPGVKGLVAVCAIERLDENLLSRFAWVVPAVSPPPLHVDRAAIALPSRDGRRS